MVCVFLNITAKEGSPQSCRNLSAAYYIQILVFRYIYIYIYHEEMVISMTILAELEIDELHEQILEYELIARYERRHHIICFE